jgi:hypothetical protein
MRRQQANCIVYIVLDREKESREANRLDQRIQYAAHQGIECVQVYIAITLLRKAIEKQNMVKI